MLRSNNNCGLGSRCIGSPIGTSVYCHFARQRMLIVWAICVALVGCNDATDLSRRSGTTDAGINVVSSKPPNTPSQIFVWAATYDTAVVQWPVLNSDILGGAALVASYNVYLDGALVGQASRQAMVLRTFVSTGLNPSTQYCYTVSAVGPSGESARA